VRGGLGEGGGGEGEEGGQGEAGGDHAASLGAPGATERTRPVLSVGSCRSSSGLEATRVRKRASWPLCACGGDTGTGSEELQLVPTGHHRGRGGRG
jgi:hypothetical protein